MPIEIWNELKQASSIGSYYNRNIKHKYQLNIKNSNMRTLFILFILSLFCCSCTTLSQKRKPRKYKVKPKNWRNFYNRIEDDLSYDKRKIILLSVIRKIPFDTLNFILRDYFVFYRYRIKL